MTRKELDALKEKLAGQREKAGDLELLAERLFCLLGSLAELLPEEVKAVIRKYTSNEEGNA